MGEKRGPATIRAAFIAMAALAVPAGVCPAATVTDYANDAELDAALADLNETAFAQGRWGDLDGPAQRELTLGPSAAQPAHDAADFDWPNGDGVAFTLRYLPWENGSPLEFGLDADVDGYVSAGDPILRYAPFDGPVSGLFLRASAQQPGSTLKLTDMMLMAPGLGVPLGLPDRVASDDEARSLSVTDIDLGEGFILWGHAAMSWDPGAPSPGGSDLAFEARLTGAPPTDGASRGDRPVRDAISAPTPSGSALGALGLACVAILRRWSSHRSGNALPI